MGAMPSSAQGPFPSQTQARGKSHRILPEMQDQHQSVLAETTEMQTFHMLLSCFTYLTEWGHLTEV